jgi:Radial spokehead-like protein
LAESLPAEVGKLRFFGQISTTGKEPYIIVEGLNPEDEDELNESVKEGRNGANKYCYWVARTYASATHEWVKLPNITSNQIMKARLFKKFLSGDLNAPVLSYPIFPGNEADLLRTQIGRIAGQSVYTSCLPSFFFSFFFSFFLTFYLPSFFSVTPSVHLFVFPFSLPLA